MQILNSSKSDGAIVIDGHHTADTLQCVHCGSHEQIIRGSGKKRAFCPQCSMGFVCGKFRCMTHIPLNAKLDFADAKSIQDQRTIQSLLKKYPLISTIGL